MTYLDARRACQKVVDLTKKFSMDDDIRDLDAEGSQAYS